MAIALDVAKQLTHSLWEFPVFWLSATPTGPPLYIVFDSFQAPSLLRDQSSVSPLESWGFISRGPCWQEDWIAAVLVSHFTLSCRYRTTGGTS